MSDELIKRIIGGSFSDIEGTDLDFNLSITEVPINLYLETLLDDQLRNLEIECLTDNQARIRASVKKAVFSLSRDLLVEIEGGVGPGMDGVVLLHIRDGFKLLDNIAKKFAGVLNNKLPEGVDFIVEKGKDRFRVDIPKLLQEPEAQQYAPLLKKLTVQTQDQKFKIAIALSA